MIIKHEHSHALADTAQPLAAEALIEVKRVEYQLARIATNVNTLGALVLMVAVGVALYLALPGKEGPHGNAG